MTSLYNKWYLIFPCLNEFSQIIMNAYRFVCIPHDVKLKKIDTSSSYDIVAAYSPA